MVFNDPTGKTRVIDYTNKLNKSRYFSFYCLIATTIKITGTGGGHGGAPTLRRPPTHREILAQRK